MFTVTEYDQWLKKKDLVLLLVLVFEAQGLMLHIICHDILSMFFKKNSNIFNMLKKKQVILQLRALRVTRVCVAAVTVRRYRETGLHL